MFRFIMPTLVLASATAAITCLDVGQTATATWVDATGATCTWTGVVGSNFGRNQVNGGDYSCNGRCGDGCTGGTFKGALGSAYTQGCWNHDICSWFNNAGADSDSKAWKDPNCGKAWTAGIPDYTGGLLAGCRRTNPKNAARVPSDRPVCVGGKSAAGGGNAGLGLALVGGLGAESSVVQVSQPIESSAVDNPTAAVTSNDVFQTVIQSSVAGVPTAAPSTFITIPTAAVSLFDSPTAAATSVEQGSMASPSFVDTPGAASSFFNDPNALPSFAPEAFPTVVPESEPTYAPNSDTTGDNEDSFGSGEI